MDALVAAQAVLCVVAPDACGLGGDGFSLVRDAGGRVTAVNGGGAAPAQASRFSNTGGASVTVPGLVHGWGELTARWGRLPLATVLAPAIRIARDATPVGAGLGAALVAQRGRLLDGGAASWPMFGAAAGQTVLQPVLAAALEAIALEGPGCFYEGRLAAAIAAAVQRHSGAMSTADLARPASEVAPPLSSAWRGLAIHVPPPMSQGVLLPLCLQALDRVGPAAESVLDHVLVELTGGAFAFRDRVGEGAALMEASLDLDLARASRRSGPRAYLHTVGVAAADRDGTVASSLISVFDDFGSGVYVPEGGFTLNNRGGGFTEAPNDAAPGRRPVHTLAPIIVETPAGPIALATPGADGQIQTLLQVLTACFVRGDDLATAIDAPRWRSEEGRLLVERCHTGCEALAALGHDTVVLADGDVKFGAVVCAGTSDGGPFCGADWRRETWAGVA